MTPAPDPHAMLAVAIEQARIQIDNARAHGRMPTAQAIPAPYQDPNQPPWNGPMIPRPGTPLQHASPS